jgi:hypothetical protein
MPTVSQVTPRTGGVQDSKSPGAARFRFASPPLAVALAVVTVILGAVIAPLSVLTHDPQVGWFINIPWIAIALVFAGVGLVVALKQPHNVIGWLLLASGALLILASDTNAYLVLDYRLYRGHLPLGLLVVFLNSCASEVAFLLLPLPILIFPEGRLPSPRWRWLLWSYELLAGTAVALTLVVTAMAGNGQPIRINLAGIPVSLNHLVGLPALLNSASTILVLPAALFWLIWVGRLVFSYRRARGEYRLQLRWLLGGAATTTISALVIVAVSSLQTSTASVTVKDVVGFLLAVGLAALPLGMGVGILKYRLYDIDRLISRTLSYAIVTGLLIGVYIGLVTLATRILPFSSPIGVAASTLVAVALFNPLRRRVQRLVDRRFNRAGYDAEAMVSTFARRVRDDIDLEVVSSEFVRAVQTSVEPSQVSLWLRPTEPRG